MSEKLSKVVLPIKNESTGVITDKEFDVGGGENTFVGTTAEWNALTTEQQNAYNCRVLTDDELPTVDVIDNLNSDSSTDALSAKQGKVLKGLVDTTQGQVSDSGDAYSPSRPYKVGDLCTHDNKLYRCITACSAGSWGTNQNCFTADTLVNVANSNYQALAEQDASQATQATPWVCESDGYIKVTNNNSDSGCTIIIDGRIRIDHYFTSAMPYETFAIFVKKGMRFYVTRSQNFNGYIQFHPIVQR